MSQQLPELREALLKLHKALVESERVTYEQTLGPITSPNHFLQLLTTDPWFAWLHPLSELVVAINEAMDTEKPMTLVMAEALIKQIRVLLVASETGEGFAKHYDDALQRDPDVVLAHADVARLLNARKN